MEQRLNYKNAKHRNTWRNHGRIKKIILGVKKQKNQNMIHWKCRKGKVFCLAKPPLAKRKDAKVGDV